MAALSVIPGHRRPEPLPRQRIDWRGKWDRLIADSRRQIAPEALPFPTGTQFDLLKAALLPAEQAAPAWRRWKDSGLTLDSIGDSSFRLLGRLWANREAAAIGADDLGLLRGVYRQSFADNVAKLTVALDAAQLLVDAGIPVLFIKGAALIATCDASLGLRRIADVDILIPEWEAERAAATLAEGGHRATYESAHSHSWHCTTPEGYEIDLHWWAYKPAGDDRSMFETAQTTELLGRQVLVPSPTESLLVAIANAFWIGGPSLRWIADSLLILRTDTIEWDIVLQRADRPGLLPGLSVGLAYLAREFDAPVPASVLHALSRRRVSWRARGAYWAATTGNMRVLAQFEAGRAHRLHFPADRPDRTLELQLARVTARYVALLAIRGARTLAGTARRLLGTPRP